MTFENTNTVYDDLIKMYKERAEISSHQYELMGRLLDCGRIVENCKKNEISSLFIYGGGFLGIQLYNSIKNSELNVCGIIDKSGKLRFDISDVAVYDIFDFRMIYKNESVIITTVQYYNEVYDDLAEFVDNKNLYYLSEIVA